jgi:hypothetical protein
MRHDQDLRRQGAALARKQDAFDRFFDVCCQQGREA